MTDESRTYTLPAYSFVESAIFTRRVYDYLTDDGYAAFQFMLAHQPHAGVVIQGTGGIRKIRWTDARRGKGKRGGTRIIYFLIDEDAAIYLLTIFDKDEMVDLSAKEKRALKELVDTERLARRQRRQVGRK